MKNNFKNIFWLIISVASMFFFILALTTIGFKTTAAYMPVQTLSDIIENSRKALVQRYVIDTAALLISGIVISVIVSLLAIVKLTLDLFKLKTKISPKVWDYGFLFLIVLSAILIIAGSALYLDQMTKTFGGFLDIKPDPGVSSALFILEIVPIPLALLPLLIDAKPKKSKNKSK